MKKFHLLSVYRIQKQFIDSPCVFWDEGGVESNMWYKSQTADRKRGKKKKKKKAIKHQKIKVALLAEGETDEQSREKNLASQPAPDGSGLNGNMKAMQIIGFYFC